MPSSCYGYVSSIYSYSTQEYEHTLQWITCMPDILPLLSLSYLLMVTGVRYSFFVLAGLLTGGDQSKLEATAALSLMIFLVHSLVEPSCLWTAGSIVAGIDAQIPKVGQ